MSSHTDSWREELKAEIAEAVVKYCNKRSVAEVIQHAINALLYDVNPAQKQSMADTLMCRNMDSNSVKESRSSTSYMPHDHPSGDPSSPFNIDDARTADAQVVKSQTSATKKRKADDAKPREGKKIRKSQAKGRLDEKQKTISSEGRLISAAAESRGAPEDAEQA